MNYPISDTRSFLFAASWRSDGSSLSSYTKPPTAASAPRPPVGHGVSGPPGHPSTATPRASLPVILLSGRVILLSEILKSRIHFTVLRIYDSSHKTFNRHRPKSARLLVSAGRAARRVSHALSPRVHFISLQLMAIITNRFMGASLPRRRAAATIVFADRHVSWYKLMISQPVIMVNTLIEQVLSLRALEYVHII